MAPGPKTQVFYLFYDLHHLKLVINFLYDCLFVFGMKACGGHQLRVMEQTSPTHPGLSQPKRESLSVGSTQERPHHQSQRPQQPSTLFLLDSPGCHLETVPHNPAVQSHLTLSCPVCTFLF